MLLHPGSPDTRIKYVEGIIALEQCDVLRLVRPPIVDGLFYPEESADVLTYMQNIGLERGKGGLAQAIIAPHGAWEISGSLAGAAFSSAGGRTGRKSPSRIVIMGPIHEKRVDGLFLTHSHSFQTPLGDIQVDQTASGWLEAYNPLFQVNDIPHLKEHSIEVLLPFVKYYFPRASIIPILMGAQSQKCSIDVLAQALCAVFKPIMTNTLLVISCNLAIHSGEAAARDMAAEFLRLFRAGKYSELSQALQSGRIVSCGGALVSALLQSGLMNAAHPCIPSDSLLSACGEQGQTVCYGALTFEPNCPDRPSL